MGKIITIMWRWRRVINFEFAAIHKGTDIRLDAEASAWIDLCREKWQSNVDQSTGRNDRRKVEPRQRVDDLEKMLEALMSDDPVSLRLDLCPYVFSIPNKMN